MRETSAADWPPFDEIVNPPPEGPNPLAGQLAPAVRAYTASATQNLGADVTVAEGPAGTLAALEAGTAGSVQVLAAAGDDHDRWAETLVRRADGTEETGLLGVRRDGDGAIDRIVWLVVERIDGFTAVQDEARPPARARFTDYFQALQDARFDDAAALYGDTGIWSHPPYRGASVRELTRSRAQLVDTLVSRRGPSPVKQIITGFWQQGGQVFLEGVIEGIPHGGSFTGLAQLASDTQVRRYVAFYSSERYR